MKAYISGSDVTATGALTLEAMATQSIDAIVVAAAVALAAGGVGGGLAGAGVWSQNRVATDVKAYILGNSTTDISAASISITATDSSGIRSIAGAAAIAASIGGAAGAISIGLSIAFNEVSDDVAAFIKDVGSKVEATSGNIVISASSSGTTLFDLNGVTDTQLDNAARAENDDPSTTGAGNDEAANDLVADRAILTTLDDAFRAAGYELLPGVRYLSSDGSKTLKKGDTVKRVLGSGVGGTVGAVYRWVGTDNLSVNLGTTTYGTASLWERVLPVVSAISNGNGWEVVAGTDVYVITKDAGGTLHVSRPTILSVSVAASIAAGFSIGTSVAISGAGAVAQNVVLTKTNAFIEGSKVTNAANVDLDAAATNSIVSVVAAVSVAIGIGVATGGIGASIGVSVARNFIGAQPGVAVDAGRGAGVHQGLVRRRHRRDHAGRRRQRDDRLARGCALGVGRRRPSFGLALSGAGADAENRVVTYIKAYIEGDGGLGVGGSSIAAHATDSSNIAAFAGAASLAFTLGAVGVSFSIAATIAQNTIENEVEAYIKNATTRVSTTTGAIGLTALETAGIDAIAAAASAAASLGVGSLSISGAGVGATNVILTKANAYIQGSSVRSGGDVSLSATDSLTSTRSFSPPPSRPRSARWRSAHRSASRWPRT